MREVSENFIHARFTEIIVSILDGGNTIRFADQGPGISDKKKAQLPGFSSAVEPMKGYIRGVGSGLPIVCDYLDFTHGSISIDDNIGQGTVVTISMNGEADAGDDEERAQVELPVGKYAPKEDQFVAERIDPGTVLPTQPVQQPMQQPMQQPVAPYYPQQGYVPQVVPTYAQMPAQPYLQQITPQVMQPVVNAYQQPYTQPQPRSYVAPALNPREKAFLNALLAEGPLGVTDRLHHAQEAPGGRSHRDGSWAEEENAHGIRHGNSRDNVACASSGLPSHAARETVTRGVFCIQLQILRIGSGDLYGQL